LRSPIGSVTARQASSGCEPNCGVEHRAPPVFGRATITLGIGPHSSCEIIKVILVRFLQLDERSLCMVFIFYAALFLHLCSCNSVTSETFAMPQIAA